MPNYFILPANFFETASLAQVNASDPSAAIQAVDRSTPLPDRVAVVACDAVIRAVVVEDPADDVVVVNRDAGVTPSVTSMGESERNEIPPAPDTAITVTDAHGNPVT